jgi:hypothetical protein
LFEELMKGRVRVAFGKDLLEQAREQFQNWAKWLLLYLIKFRACKVASSACFNLHGVDEATLPQTGRSCNADNLASAFSAEFLGISASG